MSKKSGGGRTYVSGYTRSDGREVSGYYRSAPSRSSSGTSTGASGISSQTYVSGYTRSDGREVSGYYRSAPSRSSSGTSTGASSQTVSVRGYTQSDGTKVSGYNRSAPSRSSSGTSTGASRTSSQTVSVSGYTRSDGTKVSGYTRTVPASSHKTSLGNVKPLKSTKSGTSSDGPHQKFYVDNAYNRRLGRAGLPFGTHVLHKDGSSTRSGVNYAQSGERCYVDNPYNRRLGRVGKQIQKPASRLIGQNTVDRLVDEIAHMGLDYVDDDGGTITDYQYAVGHLRRHEAEEEWSKSGIDPSTDISKFPPGIWSGEKIIAFSELKLKEQRIGQGGFGEVYAGLWHKTPIAYKKFLLQRMSRKNLGRFMTEVKVNLSTLDHPNTVKIFGVVVEEGNIGIVMEYMTRSLFQAIFIDEKKLINEEKKKIVTRTVSALTYLHSKNISHGDIKSENILLDVKNNAKLCDFGLSTIRSSTETSRSCQATPGQGTPRYSAPEVLRGELLKMDELFPTDVYSLAVVVFELLAEEIPFEGLNAKQLEANVGGKDMRPIVEVQFSKPIADLLDRCWNRNASQRPTADQFQTKWSDIEYLFQ